MSEYTVTFRGTTYIVAPATFWTISVAIIIAMFAVILCAVSGLWKLSPLLVLAWVVLGSYIKLGVSPDEKFCSALFATTFIDRL